MEPHVCTPESFEDLFKVFDVLLARVELHYDVVHVHLHTSADKTLEDLIHEPLVGRFSVLQTEQHHLIVVVSAVRHEGRLLLVPWVHTYLVVARVSVQETKDLVVGRAIYKSVDVREWIRILRASLV